MSPAHAAVLGLMLWPNSALLKWALSGVPKLLLIFKMGSLCTVWAGIWSSFLKQEDFLDLSSPFLRKTDIFLDLDLLWPATSSWSSLVVTASFEGFCETWARVKKPWANDNG